MLLDLALSKIPASYNAKRERAVNFHPLGGRRGTWKIPLRPLKELVDAFPLSLYQEAPGS